MPRVKNQDARREDLRTAMRRAIAERGPGGVRVRDVAREAGMSPQSVLYYYPDLDELVEESIANVHARYADERRSVAEGLEGSGEQLRAVIEAGFPEGEDDEHLLVLYQSVGAVRASLTLQTSTRAMTERQIDLYQRILEVGEARGEFHLAEDARVIASNLVALEDAYGGYIVERAGVVDHDQAVEMVLSYARMATGATLLPLEAAS
jgi:AcrR family transcriptional regulator